VHVQRWTEWTTTRARQVGRRVLRRGTSSHVPGPLSPAEVDQIRAIVRSELAAAAPAQSRDVWTRYKVYRPNGALTPVLEAVGELVARTARIEAKTDRLLGVPSRPPEQQAQAPQRRFRIPLPMAPQSLRAAGVQDTREIDAVVDVSMFVPRVLAEKGFGGYEADALPHFLAALSQAPDGAFLDIGLNVGPYALLARAHSTRDVVGFEPTPDLAAAARSVAEASGLGYPVEQLALGAEDGTATLYLSDSTDSSNSLSGSFRPNSYTLEVPLERLDSWTARTGVQPGLLKIDTETTEPAVVAGGLQTIERARPWIFCEVLPGGPADELESLLAPLGLHRYHLSGQGALEEQPHLFGHPGEYMWLLTPTPLTERHWALAEQWRASLAACGVGREVPLSGVG
jgi:FkbM family methyltransferase